MKNKRKKSLIRVGWTVRPKRCWLQWSSYLLIKDEFQTNKYLTIDTFWKRKLKSVKSKKVCITITEL